MTTRKKRNRRILPISIGVACCLLVGVCGFGLFAISQQQSVQPQASDEALPVSDTLMSSGVEGDTLEDGTPIITNENGSSYVANQVLLTVDSALDENALSQRLEEMGVQVSNISSVCEMSGGESTLMEVTYAGSQDPADLSTTLASSDLAVSVEPNYIAVLTDEEQADDESASEALGALGASEDTQDSSAELQATSINDTYKSELWHLTAIKAYEAWDSVKVSGSVTVAVLDSGVDYDHADLKDNLILGDYAYNVVSDTTGSAAVDDTIGHGTHVTGIVAAVANNSTGVAGVSYNAKVLPVKITNTRSFDSSNIVKAIEYVIKAKQSSSAPSYIKNIKVISLSSGTSEVSTTLNQAATDAKNAGITLVAAAGNDGSEGILSPASSSSAVAVGSVASSSGSYTRSDFSSYGSELNVVAPGSEIYSTYLDNDYSDMSGTSMATPVVSGVMALLYAKNSSLTTDAALSALTSTATDMGTSGWDKYYGSGLVNAKAAVAAVGGDSTTSYTASFSLSGISSPGTDMYIDGVKYPMTVSGTTGKVTLSSANARVATLYTYNKTSSDPHEVYPTHMYVWLLQNSGGSSYTVTRQSGFDDILQYAGSSIRLTGNKGIRMITGVPTSLKTSLTGSGYNGWRLEEYGTAIQFDETLNGDDVLLTNTTYKNYAYKRATADPVYSESGGVTKYTNVLVGFKEAQCSKDLSMRPYIILGNTTSGETITIYGGTVHRSIGYVALQNKDAYSTSTEAGQYIWGIIRAVYGNTYG